MDYWIKECEFERLEPEEDPVTLEGGMDEFERVDIREKEDSMIHIFKLSKRTPLFEVEIRWNVEPDEEDLDDDELKEQARNKIMTVGSYHISEYLNSMNLPPLQGLLFEEMAVTYGENVEEDESDN